MTPASKIPVYGANGIIGATDISLVNYPTITIGRVGSCGAINMTSGPAWVSDNAMWVDSISDKICIDYLYFALKSLSLADGAKIAAMPSISQKHISNKIVPCPHKTEQLQIASFLKEFFSGCPIEMCTRLPVQLCDFRRIVARIEELAARIEEARELRKLAVEDSRFLLTTIFHKIIRNLRHNKMALREVAEKRTGLAYKSEDFSECGSVPVVRLREIGTKMPTAFLRNPEDYPNVWLERGDIILAKTSFSTGSMCIWPGPRAVLNQNAIRIRAKSMLDQRYLFLWLQQQVHHFLQRQLADPNFYPYIREKDLMKWEIPIPLLDEQSQIVERIGLIQTKLDALKRYQAETAAELDALLPAVLERAFRGEL
jgi:restriction endonuclease S subunit